MDSVDGVLSGKVAVVTGAGRGIGEAIAVGYAAAGAAVCCVARTESEIAGTVLDIRRDGGTATSVQADVRDYVSVAEAFGTAASEFGGIDVLVINAGGNLDQSRDVERSSPEQWTDTVQLNLVGAYHTARAAIPHLKERGAGKIIAMGSGLGHRGRLGKSAIRVGESRTFHVHQGACPRALAVQHQCQRAYPRPRPHRPRCSLICPRAGLGLPRRQRVGQDP